MQKLLDILAAKDEDAISMCIMELAELGYSVITDDVNYVFGIPRTHTVTPVLLMAHIDTCRTSDAVVLKRNGDTLYNDNPDCGCLGADDRAGVYVVLEIAKMLEHKPYILLTTGEEAGYGGAKAVTDADHPECDFLPVDMTAGKKLLDVYAEDIYAVVQFDRKGFNEAAFYRTNARAETLKAKVESLGYSVLVNGTSDSILIETYLGVAGVNLSCGFLHQHTPKEMLLIPAIPFAVRNGIRLLALIDERIPLPEAEPIKFSTNVAHYPPRKEDAYIMRSTRCDICDKRRSVTYLPKATACVCDKCINRAKGAEFIDSPSVVINMRQELDNLRDSSKRANSIVDDPCPLCLDTHNLSPQRNGVSLCKKCMTYFLPQEDRVYFWSDRDSKHLFYRMYDNPVPIMDMDMPVGWVPIEWCHVCGLIHHRADTTNYNGFIVCRDCDGIRKPD